MVNAARDLGFGPVDENGLREIYTPTVAKLQEGPPKPLKVQISRELPWISLTSYEESNLPPLVAPRPRHLPAIPKGNFEPPTSELVNPAPKGTTDYTIRRRPAEKKEIIPVDPPCLRCRGDGTQCSNPRKTRSGVRCLPCRSSLSECEWQSGGIKRKGTVFSESSIRQY